ncbi:hypothetical protein [Leptonema illini]|uniref:Uncharacterized protein n=1 Tax=Leptonema illini DSM 21528 TaxID=929563 RepID=H2CL39_9LEPT|nr:hypothetical protein [Leptonema illini]EHQ07283.1 hypothetical protein Lepil_2610 [Leptonema illini DSM 21528]
MHREKETIRSLLSALVCLLSLSCMQAEKFSLDTSGIEGLLIGGLSYDGGLFGTNPSYTVGGSISGYNGSGMVLQNNGTDSYTVPTGATDFTLPSGLADGSAFNVTVATAPGNPPQQCTVTGGTGTINAANAVGVSIACTDKAWGATQTVGNLSANTTATPRIRNSIDGSGTGRIAYLDRMNAGVDPLWLLYQFTFSGGAWSAGQNFSGGGSHTDLGLSTNAAGKTIVAINATSILGNAGVYTALYEPTTGWDSAVTRIGTESCPDLRTGVTTNGQAVLTCLSSTFAINYAAFTQSIPTSFASSQSCSSCTGFSMTTAGNSVALASFQDSSINNSRVFRWTGAGWENTNTPNQSDNTGSAVSTNEAGTIFALFRDGNDDLLATNRTGSTWSSETTTGCAFNNEFSAGIDGNGNSIAAWISCADNQFIHIRMRSSQSGWQTLQSFDEGATIRKGPVIAVNEAGFGFVFWTVEDTPARIRFVRINTITGSVGAVQQLATTGDGYSLEASINAKGQTVVSWSDGSSGAFSVKAKVLE